jgi:Rps23 Pro-64 3,4-dihydroxylase Tpa1-like proline 4-hydroxylase
VTRLRLNPALDVDALAAAYARDRRVRVPALLAEEGLANLYWSLADRDDWWHLINTADGVVELDRAGRAALGESARAELDAKVADGLRTGFQYRYEGLKVPRADDSARASDPLACFSRLMASVEMVDLLRAITGFEGLAFTDGHATAYGAGDFLTGHDDDVEGKDRIAAYVFGLTPRWRLEWGGLLLFHGPDEASVSGQVPRFNTLDLFAVPQRHSVSMVAAAAPVRRFAVTGWLRAAA